VTALDVTCILFVFFSGANFTAYQEIKKLALRAQPELIDLPSWQHMVIGLISGAMGPFSNAPIDTIKTREQKLSSSRSAYPNVFFYHFRLTEG
jgi:solute carrier family 25 (mitochondrial citrate transporter), member 1